MRPYASFLLLAALGCSGLSVSSDYDPEADFTRLKTWDWFPKEAGAVQSLLHARIERAVEESLKTRGYARAAGAKPDVLVAYDARTRQRVESSPSASATAVYGYGWRRTFVVGAGSDLRVYDEGTLILDVVDPSAKTLLWRGTAKGAVEPDATPEARDARIREAVDALLERFPPKR